MDTHQPLNNDNSNAATPLLTRSDVENLLPDYAFGELATDEAARVEAALRAYPDLQEELTLIRESFDSIETEIEAMQRADAQRLRNLTVHVQDRIRAQAVRKARRWQIFRFVAPALATVALVAIVVLPNSLSEFVRNRMSATNTANSESALVLHPEEIKALEESQPFATGLLDADVHINDKALADALDKQLSAQENKMASRVLHKETMAALSRNKSAFRDFFDNSAEMQDVTDDDVASVAAALTAM
jgi:hypothetical protein